MLRCLFLFLLSQSILLPAASAQVTDSQGPFEETYRAWRESMIQRDVKGWQNATATYRQHELRNRMISAKRNFSTELFDQVVQAPQLAHLTKMETFVKGDTASVVYFGKADFGVSNTTEVKNNFVVIHYIHEGSGWKFDQLRVVKFGADSDMMGSIRSGDLSFLEGEEFQPRGTVPPIPPLLPKPDRIGELWITAVGFQVSVEINRGNHKTEISNDFGKDIIIGGLKKGSENHISLRITPVPVASDTKKHLEIAVYSALDGRSPASRSFHYRPDPEKVPSTYEAAFRVSQ